MSSPFEAVQKKVPLLCSAEQYQGTPRFARGDISHSVLPRRASAEGPLASLGVTKKEAWGDLLHPVMSSKSEASPRWLSGHSS